MRETFFTKSYFSSAQCPHAKCLQDTLGDKRFVMWTSTGNMDPVSHGGEANSSQPSSTDTPSPLPKERLSLSLSPSGWGAQSSPDVSPYKERVRSEAGGGCCRQRAEEWRCSPQAGDSQQHAASSTASSIPTGVRAAEGSGGTEGNHVGGRRTESETETKIHLFTFHDSFIVSGGTRFSDSSQASKGSFHFIYLTVITAYD